MVWFQMIVAEDAGDHVGGAGEGQARAGSARAIGDRPTPMMPTPQAPAAMITIRPCRWTRPVQPEPSGGQQRADRRRGVEQAQDAPARRVCGEERVQRLGHAEEHRVDVDQVGAQQFRAALGVPQAGRPPSAATGGRRPAAADRAHQGQADQRDREGGQVERVHPVQVDACAISTPASAGPPSWAICMPERLQRHRGGISAGGTSRGTIASSAGRCRPSTEAVSAATTYSSQRCGLSERALISSTPHRAAWRTRRRGPAGGGPGSRPARRRRRP